MKKRQWLADMRKQRNLTHEQAAAIAGVDRSTYTKAENGWPVSVPTAKKIASALQFDWARFFEDECDEKGQNTA